MGRSDWGNLPAEVRDAVERQAGTVLGSEPAPAGEHSDITATLHTSNGPVFVKGTRTDLDGHDLRSLRREVQIHPHVSQYTPRLLWTVEAGGWLIVGFQRIDSRHGDYSPGSPDLTHLEKVVEGLQSIPCPDIVTRCIENLWAEHIDTTLTAGDVLLHLDLNPANLLITDDRAYLIDWGWVARGQGWIELATLIQWLIGSGHSPQQAEAWVSRFPAWNTTDPATLDLFATANADRWQSLTADDPPAWAVRLAELTRQWADYRTTCR
jgi:Phosphotransferase enzyme family